MAEHSVRLNQNEINNALFNMIISQQVFADNIAGTYSSLVEQAKVDGTLYGDSKFYYSTDCIPTHEWGNDAEAPNLLNLDRNKEVSIQKLVIDKFRQVRCTVDDYLSKRAFGDEGTFGTYNSVLLAWIYDSKRIYESRLYNTFIGNHASTVSGTKQNITLTLPAHASGETNVEAESVDRRRAQKLAKEMADLFVDLKDATRDYNDYKYMRSYSPEGFKVIWNSDYVNKIEKIDLPTIFHKDGLMVKMGEEILPSKYFGNIQTTAVAAADNDGSFRSMIEKDYTVGTNVTHCFPGDKIPAACAISANEAYVIDPKKICIIVKQLPPMMGAFSVGTSFFNARSLTTNHYVTWGFSYPEHLKNYPFIVIKEA